MVLIQKEQLRINFHTLICMYICEYKTHKRHIKKNYINNRWKKGELPRKCI